MTRADIIQAARQSPLGTTLTIATLTEQFARSRGWEQQYRQLIQLAKQLPPLPASYQQPAYQVRGCESQVWLAAEIDEGRLWLLADSDARIIKGLLAVILAAANGRPLAELAAFDWEDYFERLQLLRHLSPSRGNGLRAIVQRIDALAAGG